MRRGLSVLILVKEAWPLSVKSEWKRRGLSAAVSVKEVWPLSVSLSERGMAPASLSPSGGVAYLSINPRAEAVVSVSVDCIINACPVLCLLLLITINWNHNKVHHHWLLQMHLSYIGLLIMKWDVYSNLLEGEIHSLITQKYQHTSSENVQF